MRLKLRSVSWRKYSLAILFISLGIILLVISIATVTVSAWSPVPIDQDPLVRMPGTQPGQTALESPNRCMNCHAGYNQAVEPGFNWKGSMMSQSARDFLFYACFTVAGQDSIWAIGTPNAVDICERCHFPKGWLEGRSDPANASSMTGADFDGVQCDFCHTLWDPFFETTYQGTREGDDWLNYWDETNASDTPSQPAAGSTYLEDRSLAIGITMFNGSLFFNNNLPFSQNYLENGSGQYFVSTGNQKRASFADADARHQMFYSRYHKSRYFCSTCHDVSNPVLANLGQDGTSPLTTEMNPAYSYFHVERTFSEFMLSAYGQQGGAAGIGPFAPDIFNTSTANNYISRCQDCHLEDVAGVAANKNGAINRPTGSVEHPQSGLPLHDMTGGNAWVSYVLASSVSGSPNYDAVNDQLLNQGANFLTLDASQGEGIDPAALLEGVNRVKQQLQEAAEISNLTYNSSDGDLSFRIQNQTGHKLISGFPEGRRMFVNIQVYDSENNLIYEVNPYDSTAGTLKGLPNSASSPALGLHEAYVDELVYEMHPTSSLTGEQETFHFALATDRYKDNRIPPKGFDIDQAAARLSEPVWHGTPAPDYFTAQEYAGGYDDVDLVIPSGADQIEVRLFYQTTSREYIEFLRDEIKGLGNLTLSSPTLSGEANAYIIQNDPFFSQLAAWGDTIWQLWNHNKDVPGASPFLMESALISVGPHITLTPTATATQTQTLTQTPTPSKTPTPTQTASPSATATTTRTRTPTATQTATGTSTPTLTTTSTPTKTPTTTSTLTATSSATPTKTSTAQTEPTSSPTPQTISINPEVGGEIKADWGAITNTLSFPAEVYTETFTITIGLTDTVTPPSGFSCIGPNFFIEANTAMGNPLTNFQNPFTMTITYYDNEQQDVIESSLKLYHWSNSTNGWVENSSQVNVNANQLTANLDHLTIFAVIGENKRHIYLPAMLKNYNPGQNQNSTSIMPGNWIERFRDTITKIFAWFRDLK
jgi:hypothetical protein